MTTTKAEYEIDTWINATWEEYLQLCDNPKYKKAKFYYNEGKLRLEMTPLGNAHSRDHYIITYAINLYASLKGIALDGHDNCSYRKAGIKEVQPDLSFYIGDNANIIPSGTNIINLEQYSPPDLVIEIANTSLADDQGEKRLLYEDLRVKEYWIVDVETPTILAFAVENKGSWRIEESHLLSGLKISLLVQALCQSRQTNHSEVGRWLLEQFQ